MGTELAAVPAKAIPTRALLASALLFGLALLLDRWVFEHVAFRDVYRSDAGRLARVAGFLPTWLMGALALGLHDRGRLPAPHVGPWRRATMLALAPMLAGLLAEVLKALIRRERPEPHGGAYFFRPYAEDFLSTKAFGLPSSHALVAFAGAAMASYLWPRTTPVWIAWACAAAATRVMAQAHFLSDVVLAAACGWLVARTLVLLVARRDAGRPIPSHPIPPLQRVP